MTSNLILPSIRCVTLSLLLHLLHRNMATLVTYSAVVGTQATARQGLAQGMARTHDGKGDSGNEEDDYCDVAMLWTMVTMQKLLVRNTREHM